ncbi:MAG: TMEM165/GDT1 family protein [Dehalococcoidia bacterium]
MSSFLLSSLLIFVAELGDKSQLVALWFSTRYRWWIVLSGVTAATLLVHLGSVALGRAIDGVVPDEVLRIVVGLSFFGFAWWSIRGDTLDDDSTRERRLPGLGAFGIVALAFFISELGDKTQLATVSLAGQDPGFVGVWLGSTFGMVAADAVAVAAGIALGKRLPQRRIGQFAALLFVAFGAITIGSVFVG